MIPLRDNIPSRKYPLINISLIILNFIIFFWELGLPENYREYIFWEFGFIPQRFLELNFLPSNLFTLISSLFLHGSWAHILGNMLFLWIFGDNVEGSMGHFRYLFFYLSAGIVANIIQGFFSFNKLIPTIGASGAIAGVLGAYLVYFPGAKILTLVFLGFFIEFIYIPASFFLVLWFLVQFLSGMASLALYEITGGIAWWAHIGGFLFGIIIAPFLRKYRRYYFYYF
ncbi:MAG: rhomboid family intramembrane serine protease [Dictyoglomaceae bacterium]